MSAPTHRTGRPRSIATRSRSAALKSSSPFMARAVMAAIRCLQAGEVRQFIKRFTRDDGAVHVRDQQRLSPLAATVAIASICCALQHGPSAAMSGVFSTSISTASPGARTSAAPPPTASRTPAIMAGDSRTASRCAIRVRKCDIQCPSVTDQAVRKATASSSNTAQVSLPPQPAPVSMPIRFGLMTGVGLAEWPCTMIAPKSCSLARKL